MDTDNPPYRVAPDGDRFRVDSGSGLNILTVGDAQSAAHYCELLNRAFLSGYREGWRDARRDREPRA